MKNYKSSLIAAVAVLGLAGCATGDALDARIQPLEEKIAELEEKLNAALQSSASAKIDAATALNIATKNPDLPEKVNTALQNSAAAKIDAATALAISTRE